MKLCIKPTKVQAGRRTNLGTLRAALNALNHAIYLSSTKGLPLKVTFADEASDLGLTWPQFKSRARRALTMITKYDGTFTEYVRERQNRIRQTAFFGTVPEAGTGETMRVDPGSVALGETSEDDYEFKIGDRIEFELGSGKQVTTGLIVEIGNGYTVRVDREFLLGNEDDGEYWLKKDHPMKLLPPKEVEASTVVLTSKSETRAAILGTEYYTFFKLKSPKLKMTRKGKEYEFRRGDPLAWRFSNNGRYFRLISPLYGPNVVFSILMDEPSLSWLIRQDPKSKSKKNPKEVKKANTMKILQAQPVVADSDTDSGSPLELFLKSDGKSYAQEQSDAGTWNDSQARRYADEHGGDPFQTEDGKWGVRLKMVFASTIINASQNPEPEMKVLSTSVQASHAGDPWFNSKVLELFELHLQLELHAAPQAQGSDIAQHFIYSWDDMETSDKEEMKENLLLIHSQLVVAVRDQNDAEADPKTAETDAQEIAKHSAVHSSVLFGGDDYQMMVTNEDSGLQLWLTTNMAVVTVVFD